MYSVTDASALREQFRRDKYVHLRELLPRTEREFLLGHVKATIAAGAVMRGDPQVPMTPACYGDPIMDLTLERMRGTVESLLGVQMYPTYSYFRLYKNGDVLPRHTDRAACEISLSINLGSQPEDEQWPLHVDTGQHTEAVFLNWGDAILYKGIEVVHWRDAFAGTYAAQVFLHYVTQDGPNREWKFDKRTRLSAPFSPTRPPGYDR